MSDLRILPTDGDDLRLELVISNNGLSTMGLLGDAVREKVKQGNPTSEGLRALLEFYVQSERLWSS